MLIKLTPPPSPTPTPTILFALAFPDPPQNLPVPPSWAAQLARLAVDDLEAPPALHALDRAAAFPSLLAEVLFDLPQARVSCSFLDGATEEWELGPSCAEMLARVIFDVEESTRAEERAREWQRAVNAERTRMEREQEMQSEQEKEMEREREREREAELERESEEKTQRAKGKGKSQSLNSPPTSLKGARPKGRLLRSRSLLMALVATFSSTSSSSSLPATPASAPATRTSFSGTSPRSPSPLRAFARRASFSALSSISRERSASTSDLPPATSPPPSPRIQHARPDSPPPPVPAKDPAPTAFRDLVSPPGSAPPSAPSSAFSAQQMRARPKLEELSPRALRRRARSTLVDAFRAHVLPELNRRVALFEPSNSALPPPLPLPHLRVVSSAEDMAAMDAGAHARGGGYHAWVACSMLRRAETRMRELEGQWPALASPKHHTHAREASTSGDSQGALSPSSVAFPTSSPTSPTRQATFEPWSSDEESGSETESDTDGEGGSEAGSEGESVGGGFGADGDEDDDDSDGSSVHTPESGHSIGYGQHRARVREASSSTTSSYFTCVDEEEDDEATLAPTVSHIRGGAEASGHSRGASGAHSHRRGPSERSEKRAQKERKRAGRAAKAEHMAFVRMTGRLRRVLAHGAAARGLARTQRTESERVREGRGVRRAWLDKKGGTKAALMQAQAFRPSGLRWVWDAADAEAEGEEEDVGQDRPPSYEDVVAQAQALVRRARPSPPMHRAHKALAHLDEFERDVDLEEALEGLDMDVDLEHLDLSDALDIDSMGLAVDGDLDNELGFGGLDVFADVSGKGRGRGRRVPVPLVRKGKGRLDAWERRQAVAV